MAKAKIMEEETVEVSKELQVVVAPVSPLLFKGNFDEVKKALKADLAKYKKAVITDENIERYKLAGREIASTRIMLTNKCKETLEMYVKLPENVLKAQFNELLAIVAEAEANIKDQLEVFEDERKAELEAVLKGYVESFQGTYKLTAELLANIEMKKGYFNKTAKEKETKDDIEEQFKAQKAIMDAYNQSVTLINQMCAGEERLNPKLFIEQLKYRTASAIVSDIVSEKERLIDQKTEEPVVPTLKAPVAGTSLGRKKEETKVMDIHIEYPVSFGAVLNQFFADNPTLKVTKL